MQKFGRKEYPIIEEFNAGRQLNPMKLIALSENGDSSFVNREHMRKVVWELKFLGIPYVIIEKDGKVVLLKEPDDPKWWPNNKQLFTKARKSKGDCSSSRKGLVNEIKIYEVIKANPHIGMAEIAKKVNLSRNTVQIHVPNLLEQERVVKTCSVMPYTFAVAA